MFTQQEFDKLVGELNARHSPEVLRLVNLSSIGAQLCPSIGHDMHLMIAEAVRCYCIVNNVSLEALKACAEDADRVQETLFILANQPTEELRPSNFCSELLKKYRQP